MKRRTKGMWPSPVYVAEFDDGTVGRASFWSPAGKPFDFAAGRRGLATIYARPEDESGLADRDGNPIKIDLNAVREPDIYHHKCGHWSHDWAASYGGGGGCGVEWRSTDKEWSCPNGCPSHYERHRKVDRDSGARGPVSLIVYPPRVIVDGYVEHDVPGEPWVRLRDPHFIAAEAPMIPPARRKRAAKPKVAADPNPALITALSYVKGLAEAIRDMKPGDNGRTRAAWIVTACDKALTKHAPAVREAA